MNVIGLPSIWLSGICRFPAHGVERLGVVSVIDLGQEPSGVPCAMLRAARVAWQDIQGKLRAIIGADDYQSWVSPLMLIGADERLVRLAAPNVYASARVRTDHLPRILSVWRDADTLRRSLIIEVQSQDQRREAARLRREREPAADEAAATPARALGEDWLAPAQPMEFAGNGRSFANFETGESNCVAVALARKLAEEPSRGDSVYLHGLNGVGKTHLLESVAARSRELYPDRKVVVVAAANFLNAFQSALRDRDTGPFKEALRSADLLLVDDIQLICGKAATQDELFQTIADLVSRGRSVLCTGDVPAEALEGPTPRMRGLLLGGFTQRIGEPDYALRRAIAARKAGELRQRRAGFELCETALDLVAARVLGTGRAVEGTMKQIFAASALLGREATMDVVTSVLSDAPLPAPRGLTVEGIKRKVALHYNLKLEDLVSASRLRSLARPRQVAMYLARKLTGRSFPDIGSRFGKRDHTTVIHAVRRIEELASSSPAFASELREIERKVAA